MTQLLEKAINKAHSLPIHEQDVLASIILDEIDSEKIGLLLLLNPKTHFPLWQPKLLLNTLLVKPNLCSAY